jgi:hypothetical protein
MLEPLLLIFTDTSPQLDQPNGMSRRIKGGLGHTAVIGAGLYADKQTAVVW